MPEFHLDTTGVVTAHTPQFAYLKFSDLDAFTQGYIEALFFTNASNPDDGELEGKAFVDLAPESLLDILKDCRGFVEAYAGWWHTYEATDEQAGRDFWFTRNGHGCGFWDRDQALYGRFAEALTEAANSWGEVDVYLGDDGQVWLS